MQQLGWAGPACWGLGTGVPGFHAPGVSILSVAAGRTTRAHWDATRQRRKGTFWKVLGERRVLRLELERADGSETKWPRRAPPGALGSEWPWL